MITIALTIAALIILSMLVTHPSMMMKIYSRGNVWWKGMMEKRKGLITNYYKLYNRIDNNKRGYDINGIELIIMLIICIMLLFVRCSNEWNGKEIGGNAYVWNNNNVASSSEYSIVWNNNNVASSSVEVKSHSTHTPMDTPPLNILSTQQIGTLPAYIDSTIPNYQHSVLPADIYNITSIHIYQAALSIILKIYNTTCNKYRRNNVEGFADIKLFAATNYFNKYPATNQDIRMMVPNLLQLIRGMATNFPATNCELRMMVPNLLQQIIYPATNLDRKMLQQIRNVAYQFVATNVTLDVTRSEMSQRMQQKELSNLLIDGCDAADYIMYDGVVVLARMMPDLYGCNVPMCADCCGETRVGVGSFSALKSGAMSALSSSVMHTFLPNISNITSTNRLPKLTNFPHTNIHTNYTNDII